MAIKPLSSQPTFNPYPAYKSSGIDWLGDIPSHWFVNKLKHVKASKKFSIVDGPFGTQLGTSDYQDEGVPLIRVADLDFNGQLILKNPVFISISKWEDLNRSAVYPEDVVVAKTGATIGKSGIVPAHFEKGLIASSCIKISPDKEKILPKFLNLALTSSFVQEQIINLSGGSTRDTINISPFSNIIVPLPPLPEQKAIATFLDHQTAKIDALIAKLERLVELLQEKRTALISQVVTKGLDPSVPMKDSGIEWLGEIPEQWEVKPLFEFIKERKVKNKGAIEDNVLSLSYGNIIRRNVENNFGLLPESFETYQIVEPGNIILRLTDLQNDKKSLRVGLAKERGIITSAYTCLEKNKRIIPEYLYALLHVYDINKVFYAMGAGVRQTMKYADLKHMPLVVPSFEDQKMAVHQIDREKQHIESLVVKLNSLINNLNEYRNSMISNCVTGKIDVRSYYGK